MSCSMTIGHWQKLCEQELQERLGHCVPLNCRIYLTNSGPRWRVFNPQSYLASGQVGFSIGCRTSCSKRRRLKRVWKPGASVEARSPNQSLTWMSRSEACVPKVRVEAGSTHWLRISALLLIVNALNVETITQFGYTFKGISCLAKPCLQNWIFS